MIWLDFYAMPAGRPTTYKPEYAEQCRRMALLGLTDKQMADVFGVIEETFIRWKRAYPELFEAILEGKTAADANVAASTYERACGFTRKVQRPVGQHGNIVEYEEYFPPDTNAARMWLFNRQKALWRDRVQVEGTGEDGALTVVIKRFTGNAD